MSDYTPTIWVEQGPPGISAENLNKIESGIDTAHSELDAHLADNSIHQTAEQVRTASDKRLVVEVSSSAPSSPVNGQIWYDLANHKFRGYANGAWL